MVYILEAWLYLLVSILAADVPTGRRLEGGIEDVPLTGEGLYIQNGFYSRVFNGKPYNSGDPRGGY